MLALHPNARTTPAVRAEIARSREPTSVLAQRGLEACQDRCSRPHKLPCKATDEERAIVCALRRTTGFALDDLTFVVRHFLAHLHRDSIYRVLRAEGLGRLPAASRPRRGSGTFKDSDLGFVHIDVKHLPKLRTLGAPGRQG